MAKRSPVMMGDLCLDCLTYKPHPNGRCGHDPYKPCPRCGKSFGWLTAIMTSDRCWWCCTGYPRMEERP